MRKKKKILIIEDDKDIRRTIELQLEMEGFEVITASDGKEGLHKADTSAADLIVLDLKLPGLPGEEICRILRDEKYKTLPIIMLTAKDRDADEVRGCVLGADCYMRKPFELDELLEKIRSLLSKKN